MGNRFLSLCLPKPIVELTTHSSGCVESWCPPQPYTWNANLTTTMQCDQVCCPYAFPGNNITNYASAQSCLLSQSSSVGSKSLGHFPGAVLGSDINYSACMTLSINSEVCKSIGLSHENIQGWCMCWDGPNQYWGITHNMLCTSCASFWGSTYGKDSLVSSYLSIGNGQMCPQETPSYYFMSSTVSPSSAYPSNSLLSGFVSGVSLFLRICSILHRFDIVQDMLSRIANGSCFSLAIEDGVSHRFYFPCNLHFFNLDKIGSHYLSSENWIGMQSLFLPSYPESRFEMLIQKVNREHFGLSWRL